jgi:hypothetical protein
MKPRSKKQKGKKFEEQVAKILHEFFYENLELYRNEFNSLDPESRKLLKPSRDLVSGSMKEYQSDIRLNLAYKYFPFIIECKKWEEFNELNIFNTLEKNKNRFLKTFLKIYDGQIFNSAKMKNKKNEKLDLTFPFYPGVIFFTKNRNKTILSFLELINPEFLISEFLKNNFYPNFLILNYEDETTRRYFLILEILDLLNLWLKIKFSGDKK